MNCCRDGEFDLIKRYDPMPKNPDGSVRRFLFRWDDGKNGERKLVRCRVCGGFYLVQAYRLNPFSKENDTLFEDYYAVSDESEADRINRNNTGLELEREMKPVFQLQRKP